MVLVGVQGDISSGDQRQSDGLVIRTVGSENMIVRFAASFVSDLQRDIV